MIDSDAISRQTDIITAPVPEFGTDAPCCCNSGTNPKTSNRGGPRPGFGGPQPGSGRPRKVATPDPRPAYALDVPHWSVISFWGQAEMSATADLARSGYETYLPMAAIRRPDPVIPTKFNIVRIPYFTGYGFIRITSTESREPILATRGIRKVLLGPDGRPECVSDEEIDLLKEKDADRLELPKVHAPVLLAGSAVHINDGPFSCFGGSVIQCDGLKTQVGVEIFGRITPVWLDRSSISSFGP
jgi:transcription antitermination factor NusG